MNTAKCPYCGTVIDKLRYEEVEIDSSSAISGGVLSCLSCGKALSAVSRPVAGKSSAELEKSPETENL